jgi:plasmid stabilization system protein ParE
MRNVVWSVRALDDLALALDYIAEDSELNADLVADRIDATARSLGHMPIGRPGRVHGMYEKSVSRTPYIIAYALSDRTVTVLRVIHGARDWPEGEWPAE